MKLTEFTTITCHPHHLQTCQCVAVAIFTDGTAFMGVYDSSNGHWLQFQNTGLEEVGYLTDLRLDHENKRIHHCIIINPEMYYHSASNTQTIKGC